MKLVSLNVGEIRHYDWRGGTDSGILKHPVQGDVMLSEYGLEGDYQADLKNHGGRDKAVLVIPEKNYGFHQVFTQPFGFLGENLTLSALDESQVSLGDRFSLGEVVLEVTQPRSPCWKLGEVMGSTGFVKAYSESGRVGFYCRVCQVGRVQQDMTVQHQKVPHSVSIQTLFLARLHPKEPGALETIQTALAHPALSDAWRGELERIQRKLL